MQQPTHQVLNAQRPPIPDNYGRPQNDNQPFIGGTPVMPVDQEPYLNPISYPVAPWLQAYPWQQNLDQQDPRWAPLNVAPSPEGPQMTAAEAPPGTYPPRLPEQHNLFHPANTEQYRHNQPSPFVDPVIYPQDKPWDQMSEYEKNTKALQDQRDVFFQKLYLDVGDLVNERQFDRLPNHNPIEGREAFMDYLFGQHSLRPNYKDKWGYLYSKYHVNP